MVSSSIIFSLPWILNDSCWFVLLVSFSVLFRLSPHVLLPFFLISIELNCRSLILFCFLLCCFHISGFLWQFICCRVLLVTFAFSFCFPLLFVFFVASRRSQTNKALRVSPGGNQVDGLPPASSFGVEFSILWKFCKFVFVLVHFALVYPSVLKFWQSLSPVGRK